MKRALSAALRICLLSLCLALLTGCLGIPSSGSSLSDPWPLADGAQTLDELLPDEALRTAALRVLNSPKPWTLSGTEPEVGDTLIEGLPNELGKASIFESLVGYRPWADAYATIKELGGYEVSYRLSDVVPEGYTRVEAFASGLEEFGHPCTYQFVVILRTEDAVPVLAAMTSITIGGDVEPL